ncbi:nuclease-related domain-containing protein [Priestia megaterium]|uniref:nuclease-related domain-containing protein n=1 Tax=Priestia megaterium TaxID=1404 RepID=UPI002570B014|nr:nuclease-related domain-containing protein [Priestia megaterium]WJD83538.1 nuclease-related domain-containing protein [Priestia megaterium]
MYYLIVIILALVIIVFIWHHFSKEIKKVTDYYQEALETERKFSRNRGEIITQIVLEDMKKEFLKDGKIKENEMFILPNLFIPNQGNPRKLEIRQIDHLLLLKTGLYIIETKHWKGTILFGATEKSLHNENLNLSFIYNMMTDSKKNEDNEQTFIFKSEKTKSIGEESRQIVIQNYGHPTKQVRGAAKTLKEFLNEKLSFNVDYVKGLVYFNYESGGHNRLINHSKNDKNEKVVFDNKTQLKKFFNDTLIGNPVEKYTPDQLIMIKNLLENINYRDK